MGEIGEQREVFSVMEGLGLCREGGRGLEEDEVVNVWG